MIQSQRRTTSPPWSLLLGTVLAVAIIGILLVFKFPWPQAAISGLLVLAIALWSGDLVAPPVAALAVISLIPVLRIAPFETAVKGFSSGMIWLFIGISILAIALRKVGLVEWAAGWVVRLGAGNASRTLLAFIGINLLMTIAVPTAVARASILVLLLDGMITAFGRDRPELPKAFALGAVMSVFALQLSVVTGTNGALYAVTWLENNGHITVTFGHWFALMAPLGLIQAGMVWWVLRRQYRLDQIQVAVPPTAGPVRMTGEQIRVVFMFGVLLLVWIFGSWFGIPMHSVTLLVATLLLMPGLGVLTWDDVRGSIPWGTALLLASAIAVGDTFQQTGMGEVIAGYVSSWLTNIALWLVTFAVLLAFLFARVIFVNLLSLLVTFLPIVTAVGISVGFNPVWLILLGLYTGSMGFFVPAQSPVAVTMASQGDLVMSDLTRLGLRLAPLWVAVLLVAAYTWWPLLGLHPFR